MSADIEALYARCVELCQAYEVQRYEQDDVIVPCEDVRLSHLEHLVHELAHAHLLGIAWRGNIGDKVEARLRPAWNSFREKNEIEAFAVTIGVMTELGLEVDESVFADECLVQVLFVGKQALRKRWRRFSRHPRCVAAVGAIRQLFADDAVNEVQP